MDLFRRYMFDYDKLCNQAVTVYREEGGEVSRTVRPKAYLEFKKTETTERTGQQESNGFLLVIPESSPSVKVGDKVYDGVGPEVPEDAMKWWRTFIPAKVDGLVVVKSADRRHLGGNMYHTEAGG